MKAEDVSDRDSLAAWLDALPRNTDAQRDAAHRFEIILAHRAAMRVLPRVRTGQPRQSRGQSLLPILILHRNLISGVASVCPSPEIRSAASAANNAKRWPSFDPDPVSSGTVFVAAGGDDTAEAAASISAAITGWKAVQDDCVALDSGRSLERMPLWSGPNPLQGDWERMRDALEAGGQGWGFWIDWYEKALAGAPQDWAGLLTEIALLPAEDWDKGADHVNALIAGLQLKHAVKNTPNAEVVSFNASTGKLRVDPISEMPRDHLAEAVEKLEGVLGLFEFEQDRGNQFRPIEAEWEIIAQAVERYAGGRACFTRLACASSGAWT